MSASVEKNDPTKKKKGGKEIPHPRRILAVSLTESAGQLSAVIKELTGTHPSPQSTSSSPETNDDPAAASSLAGTTHHLQLSTPYYTASVPIWLDLISSPEEWSSSFLSEEAKEVLEVLGGVVVVVDLSAASSTSTTSNISPVSPTKEQQKELVKEVGRVVKEGLGGWDWDGVCLTVGVGRQQTGAEDEEEELDEWEDVCAEAGLEFVHFVQLSSSSSDSSSTEKEKRNEYGERVGIARVREALEANDWSGGGGAPGDHDDSELDFDHDNDNDDDDDDDQGGFDPKTLGFGFDKGDFEGLKRAIWEQIGEETETGEGSEESKEKKGGKEQEEEEEGLGDDDIKNLEQMMLKLQAVRDMSAGLPEQQRKRMAKQAVEEVMREL
ncbi:hypothetical protein B0T21DRAFT_329080 [Apiosordaria backusii]|uniref:Uncharacterized protein n=1 Tax=Apiosordaria backusii TaxID=314023 RepID=A0AA40EF88_9PEZI|nr:hypothetical protein B0T21DRAFT_329080 [Apiosordaria backusii]